MSLLLTDKAVDLAGAPIANSQVVVSYSGLDPEVLQGGTWRVGEGAHTAVYTGADGSFNAPLLWPSEMKPATGISAIVTLPDGVSYAGVVPDGVAGPLTLDGLLSGYSGAPYSWGKVTTVTAPVQVVGPSVADLQQVQAMAAPTYYPFVATQKAQTLGAFFQWL